jgi:tRNA(Leu) C34 or U34 (ribose-2'-O)-methylase TrmL
MTEKEKEPDPDKDSSRVTITYWAKRGMSLRSMAAKCGMEFNRFYDVMNQDERGKKPLMLLYEAGRAEYEATRLELRDQLLFDPETSKGLKAKILRDDLKEFEEHAPATRAIKIQVEDAASVFTFEPYTKEQETAIKAQHNTDESTPED